MQQPDYTFPRWKKIVGYAIAAMMIILTIALPRPSIIWPLSIGLLILTILFFPIIPASFRQGCKQYGYTLILLIALALFLIIGGMAFYLFVTPVMAP